MIFADTESELDILAAQAAYLRLNPPGSVTAPWHRMGDTLPAPADSSPVIFVTGTAVTPQSEEFRSLAGMAHLLRAVKEADMDIDKIYIATGSGVMWMNPGAGTTPPDYDPRTRPWYTDAVLAGGSPVWSEPYVDAAGGGLMVTCSKAVTGRYGTWVIATDITTDSINANILNLTLNGAGLPGPSQPHGTGLQQARDKCQRHAVGRAVHASRSLLLRPAGPCRGCGQHERR